MTFHTPCENRPAPPRRGPRVPSRVGALTRVCARARTRGRLPARAPQMRAHPANSIPNTSWQKYQTPRPPEMQRPWRVPPCLRQRAPAACRLPRQPPPNRAPTHARAACRHCRGREREREGERKNERERENTKDSSARAHAHAHTHARTHARTHVRARVHAHAHGGARCPLNHGRRFPINTHQNHGPFGACFCRSGTIPRPRLLLLKASGGIAEKADATVS